MHAYNLGAYVLDVHAMEAYQQGGRGDNPSPPLSPEQLAKHLKATFAGRLGGHLSFNWTSKQEGKLLISAWVDEAGVFALLMLHDHDAERQLFPDAAAMCDAALSYILRIAVEFMPESTAP